jgi:hypothetical protein
MKIVNQLNAGVGAGHLAEFGHGSGHGHKNSSNKNIAIIINHKDKFITLIDTNNNTKITDIPISTLDDSVVGSVQIQSHPEYHFSNDGKYFYIFLTEEGSLVKVDLDQRSIVNRLNIGGKLAMGSFVNIKKDKKH